MSYPVKTIALAIGLNLLPALCAVAGGPPFLTDDPEPLDYHHWEAYLFALGDHSGGGYLVEGPAFEMNYGALPDTQLHLIVPMTTVGGGGAPAVSGLGDMEFGVKYRFVHETNGWPQIGVFPLSNCPPATPAVVWAMAARGFNCPCGCEKSWGPWMTDIGGGAVLNSAPGQRDHPYGGWLVERSFGEHLSLGGELFAQGRDTEHDSGFAVINLGGSYNLSEHFSLLFSAGHSVVGNVHTLWYFALYWTW